MCRQNRCKEEVLQGVTTCLRKARPPILRARLRVLQRSIEREDNYYISPEACNELTMILREFSRVADKETNEAAIHYLNRMQELTRSVPRPKKRGLIMGVIEKGKKVISGLFTKKTDIQELREKAEQARDKIHKLITDQTAKLDSVDMQIAALMKEAGATNRASHEFKNLCMQGDALTIEKKSLEKHLDEFRRQWLEMVRSIDQLSNAEKGESKDSDKIDIAVFDAIISSAIEKTAERAAEAREMRSILAKGDAGLYITGASGWESPFEKLLDKNQNTDVSDASTLSPFEALLDQVDKESEPLVTTVEETKSTAEAQTAVSLPIDV